MKTVLITGVSSGIGEATAKFFAKKGWNVIGTVRTTKNHKNTNKITFIQLDVTKPATIEAAKTFVQKEFNHIDVLINNAGYGLFGKITECTEQEILKQFDTNVHGHIRMIKAFMPKRAIVNITSMVGKTTFPNMGYYCATKYALESLSEALWYDLYNSRTRVKIIEPGKITTHFGSTTNIKSVADKLRESGGSNPAIIAKLIYKAANDRSRKLRYHGGKFSTTIIWSRRLLPDWLYLNLMRLTMT